MMEAFAGETALAAMCCGNGAEDWNRTSDTSIFSAVLYRLSYLGTGRGASGRLPIITAGLRGPQEGRAANGVKAACRTPTGIYSGVQ